MSQRVCAVCGAALPLQHGRGGRRKMCEHCSPPRRRGPAMAPAVALVPTPAPDGLTVSDVTTATVAELQRLGQADSVAGVMAVALAKRIDSGQEPGGALAQLVKAHRDTMATAYAAAHQEKEKDEPNLLEQIRRQREARLAAEQDR